MKWRPLLKLTLALGLAATTAWAIQAVKFRDVLTPSSLILGGAIAFLLGFIPLLNGPLASRLHQKLASLGRPKLAIAVGAVAAIAIGGLIYALNRPAQLLWHDEFQFHLQSQLLAQFRLWMPPHPLSAFFDTFYVLMQPVYAPQSFPGASMLFTPTVWLHLPTWFMPLTVTGVACGLLWWVLSELIDPWCATVGIVVLICSFGFQRLSTMYMAQIPMLMFGLAAFASMLCWRKRPSCKTAALVGLFLGWAAITRPLDAMCYGAIVGLGMLPTFLRLSPKTMLLTTLVILATATPFLTIQAIFNYRVTDSIFYTPFSYYNDRDQPALAYGAGSSDRRPLSDIPQKQAFYDYFTLAFVKLHNHPKMTASILWQNRLNVMQSMLGPTVYMLPIAAIGLLGLRTPSRLLLFAILPAFVIAYHWYPIFLFHYIAFALPGLILLFALAPECVSRVVSARRAPLIRRLMGLTIIGMSLATVIHRSISEPIDQQLVHKQAVDASLGRVSPPAIVLFTPPKDADDMHMELVYNDDVAWPDDAPIIRAHDRGSQNLQLFAYYARIAPQREAWLFDRGTMQLTRLGRVDELASDANRP